VTQPLVLAVETATQTGSVAIVSGEKLVVEVTLAVGLTHGERLLGAIDRALVDAGVRVTDLGGLSVSSGPGSFTGLRIGLATVKGIAQAHPLPLAAVPTLEALAWNLAAAARPVAAILDAKKGELYGALFAWDEEQLGWRRLIEEGAFAPEDFAERLAAAESGPVLLLGEGALAYRDVLEARLGKRAQPAPGPAGQPRAAWVGWLGARRIARGEVEDPVTLVPRYLRPSEAELARARRMAGGSD
jgi:tRNA threonylcarbamoyladenosine biosynthesis protein TsaB